jgi:hypothetical protein
MSIVQSIAEILQNHVTLGIEIIDRLYLNVCSSLTTGKRSGLFFPAAPGPTLCQFGFDGPHEPSRFWRPSHANFR